MRKKTTPSMDNWINEAKADPKANQCGMFLFHNGIVRQSARAKVRAGQDAPEVKGMVFGYDQNKLDAAIKAAYQLPGIFYVRVWLNEGQLTVGDDIMLVLIGGDIRPHVIDALQSLVGEIKTNCVTETELY